MKYKQIERMIKMQNVVCRYDEKLEFNKTECQILEEYLATNHDCYVTKNTKNQDMMLIPDWEIDDIVKEHGYSDMNEFIDELYGDYGRWGFLDEYHICGNCECAISWEFDNYLNDGCHVYCTNCLENDEDLLLRVLEEKYINNPDRAICGIDYSPLFKYGFHELDINYRKGLHEGDNDNPLKIHESLIEHGYDYTLFVITHSDPFTCEFTTLVKKGDTLFE